MNRVKEEEEHAILLVYPERKTLPPDLVCVLLCVAAIFEGRAGWWA
jgi:hypothetical protein